VRSIGDVVEGGDEVGMECRVIRYGDDCALCILVVESMVRYESVLDCILLKGGMLVSRSQMLEGWEIWGRSVGE